MLITAEFTSISALLFAGAFTGGLATVGLLLGAARGSRIYRNLRDRHGYTYSAWANFSPLPGSPAARAGLREGDELAAAANIIPIYGSFGRPITLTVRRNGALVPITYRPQSGQAEAWEWVAAPTPARP